MAKSAILAIIAAAFLSLGCVSLYSEEIKAGIEECNSLSRCEGHAAPTFQGYCTYPQAECMTRLALDHDMPSLCNEINEPIQNCLSHYGEPLYPDSYYYPRDGCFGMVARERFDYKLCEQIKDATERETCLSDLGGGYSSRFEDCGWTQNPLACRYDLIRETWEARFCLRLQEETDVDKCLSYFAFEFHDSTICEYIKANDSREACNSQWN
ncbi:MAG: hypothetical protein V1827_04655, partial [Candidatus Micrarchaeota archaeon]